MKWQDVEKGAVCSKFSDFVDTWDEQVTKIEWLYKERTKRSVIYDMCADNVKFSFRKVGNKYTILFAGEYEFIQKETFEFFEDVCEQFIEEISV